MKTLSLIIVLNFVCEFARAGATYVEPGFADVTFVNNANLGNMTAIAWAPDGSRRLFAARKTGEVRVVKAGALLSNPWATMSPIYAPTNSECGLLGMCFDPNFLSNHYVYLFVTVSATEQQIVRYTDDPATDTGGNRTVIMAGLPTTGTNHNAGCVRIGPDGKLYWTVGNTNNFAQGPVAMGENGDLSNLASKVGRANLDGSVPFDNPFYDGSGPNNDYAFAGGLRNPFKFEFQPTTGKLWVQVVGDNYEQIFAMDARDNAGDRTRENAQGAGLITPLIKYRTNTVSSDTKTIAVNGAVRSNNVVTFTTTAIHGYRKGENITVSGVTEATFNGQFYVASTPTTMSFTVAQSGPDVSSGNGTIVPLQISTGTSAAVTGGCFYDSTLFPAQYRGNFFFGDVASNRIMRSTLDTDNSVKTVDYFATNAQQFVDITVGPDGAMYWIGHNTTGAVYRMVPTSPAPGIVVSPSNLNVMENGSAVLNVCLATAPTGSMLVSLQRSSGNPGITFAPSTLTFTSSNFSTPQTVTISAAKDSDINDDLATLAVMANGLNTESVQVTAIDIDGTSVVLSSSSVTINEGQTGSFTIALPMQPTSNVTVNLSRSGDSDVSITSSMTLTFTNENWNVPQTVMLAVALDADTTNDSATINISGTGLTPSSVSVTVIDNTANAPQFTTNPITSAVVNAPYIYIAGANGIPASVFSLTTQPSGMTMNAQTGEINWTAASTGNFNVTVKASNGVPPDATQRFSITVTTDQPPTASISKPTQNEIIAGTNTEFYGNGIDDVGTIKAEFYVDGALKYTDNSPGHHYHIFGAHLLFDTTIYANGPHKLKMTVYDSAGQSGSQEIDVTIQNPSVVTPGSATATVGAPFNYQTQATNYPTNYSASGLPSGLSIDAASGLISGTPAMDGSFTVNLSVTNAAGTSSGTLNLTVNPAPIPPVPAPVVTGGNASGTVGLSFSYKIVATNSPSSFGAVGLPGGLSLDISTGQISGSPSEAGTFTVTLSAANSSGIGTAQLTLAVVSATVVVVAPVVQAMSASGKVGAEFSLQISATNNPTAFNAKGLPQGLSVNARSGLISGTPIEAGVFVGTLEASNSAGTGSGVLTLTISANQKPVFASGISVSPQPLVAGVEATLSAVATDAENDPISIAWDFGDGSSATGATVTHTFAVSGMYSIQVTASDKFGGSGTQLQMVVFPSAGESNPRETLLVKSVSLKMNFAADKHSSLKLTGTLPAPKGFAPAQAIVHVTLGGYDHMFTLDARGASLDKKLKIQLSKNNGPLKFSLTIDGAEFEPLRQAFPNANIPLPGKLIMLPLSVKLGEVTELQLVGILYTAKEGKSGAGKVMR